MKICSDLSAITEEHCFWYKITQLQKVFHKQTRFHNQINVKYRQQSWTYFHFIETQLIHSLTNWQWMKKKNKRKMGNKRCRGRIIIYTIRGTCPTANDRAGYQLCPLFALWLITVSRVPKFIDIGLPKFIEISPAAWRECELTETIHALQ